MAEMAEAAIAAGLDELCFTDHMEPVEWGVTTPRESFDWAALSAEFEAARQAAGDRIVLRLGIELGDAPWALENTERLLAQAPPLDFVIGSCHNLDEAAGGRDFYLLPYDTLEDCYRALDNYFQSMLAMAASPCYDVVGHVIYPLRYMNGPYDTPSLDRYRDQIREILRLAIQSGRGIEINTWKGQTLREWIPILRDYRELGGEILTVGSDAHAPEPLGRGIREAYGLMADCGFRYVAVYHARKPEMIRLK